MRVNTFLNFISPSVKIWQTSKKNGRPAARPAAIFPFMTLFKMTAIGV